MIPIDCKIANFSDFRPIIKTVIREEHVCIQIHHFLPIISKLKKSNAEIVPLLMLTAQKNSLPSSKTVNSPIVTVALYTAELPTMMGSTSRNLSRNDTPNDDIDISTLLVIPLTAVALHSSVRG